VSNLSYQGLTLLFLAMTYGLIVLCASLMGGQVMSVLYVVSGPIATGLFIYLILALLKPERFARISTAGFSWLAISGLCGASQATRIARGARFPGHRTLLDGILDPHVGRQPVDLRRRRLDRAVHRHQAD
jgi:K+-transporting ATPase KdpF subunit